MSDYGLNYTVKFPPRGAWKTARSAPSKNFFHGGYVSEKIKPCPVCGRYAVFEEDVYHKTPPDVRAKYFYGYCPSCELRTRDSGTLKEAVLQWQARQFSEDSWLYCHRLKPDTYGCVTLCARVCRDAYDDAIFYVEQMQNGDDDSGRFKAARGELNKIEEFFRKSPLAFAFNPSAVISKMRKELYPDMSPEDRMKIPLRMAKLYNGEEYVRKCTQKKSSKRQP